MNPTDSNWNPSRSFSQWADSPLPRHAVAIVLLMGVTLARWHEWVLATFVLSDEIPYMAAFELAAEGRSPFEASGFIYPAFFAQIGGWALERIGHLPVMACLRLLNVFGIATTAWVALAWAGCRWRWRVLAASIWLLIAPGVAWGIWLGNLSLAVAGLTLLGLAFYRRRPLTSGFVLGVGLALKPVGAMAALLLILHRPLERTRRQLVAGGLSVAFAALLIGGSSYLGDFLAHASVGHPGKTLTLHRLPWVLGLSVPSLWISLPLALLFVWMARRFELGPARLISLATAACVTVSPIIWSHTLVLVLPLQVLALQLAIDRFRNTSSRADSNETLTKRAMYEMFFVALAVAALQFSRGAEGIDDQGALIQLIGAGLPALAPFFLTGFVLLRHEPF